MKRCILLFQILWAFPNTLFGLLIACLGMCFGGHVQIRGRAIEFYDGGTKWFLHRFPYGQYTLALTLGHTILGQTDASLDIARDHETIHLRQYERWGPFFLPAYFLSSLYMSFSGRQFYRDNPFEREAYGTDGTSD